MMATMLTASAEPTGPACLEQIVGGHWPNRVSKEHVTRAEGDPVSSNEVASSHPSHTYTVDRVYRRLTGGVPPMVSGS